ncbi:hypothetical protein D3C86_1656140 [compost metagenome]
MICSRHSAQAFRRVDQHRLRRLERLPRFQQPIEVERIDSNGYPRCRELVHFRFSGEIAAVYQAETERFSVIFGRIRPKQSHERIQLVAARTSSAIDPNSPSVYGPSLHMSFLGPSSGQVQAIIIGIGEIQAGA